MEIKIAIVQFLFKNTWKVLSDSLGANPSLTSQTFDAAPDLLKFCSEQENCLVIANVASKEDLIQLATFIKASKKGLKSTVLKVVVLNTTSNKQFEKAIGKLGSVEILEPTVNVKALRFKMDFWMKAMRAQSKKLGDLNKKTIEVAAQESAPEAAKNLIQVPPLECESDIWVLSRESDCKRIIGRWMLKLMGPGPYVGQWAEVPNKPNVWIFQIKKTFADQFVSGEGNWFFRGDQKPEFNWQENRWMMTGDAFELFFYDGKTSLVRSKLENKVLTIAGNSVYAKTKEPLIIDSFDKELVFKSEADKLSGQGLEFENEGDLGGHLEGEINEKEEAGKGHLHGKIKDKEEAGKGHLEGKVKDKEEAGKGHLEGKVKDHEPEKPSLKGKLSAEETEKAPEKKEKHAQSNEKLASNWDGKIDEKVKEEKPVREDYKQHNDRMTDRWGGEIEERAFDPSNPAPLKEKSEKTDHLKSHWGGKGATEGVEGNGLSAPGTSAKEGSLLDLKPGDKEHQTHYKNHNEAKTYEAGELGKHLHKQEQEPEGNRPEGKGHTDKLASHYGTKNRAAGMAGERDPLNGESGTERLATHMGRRNTERSAEESQDRPALGGKGQTDRIKGHYGSGERSENANKDLDDVTEVLEELSGEFAAKAGAKGKSNNILPFPSKAEEKDLEKLTENAVITSFIIQDGRKYECALNDYFDNNVIFNCSAEGLKNSEKASFEVSLDYQRKNALVNCQGLVMSIDQDGSGGFFVTIEIPPSDVALLSDFMGLLKSRQENINSFLTKAKGY